jgi:hypothetical protein
VFVQLRIHVAKFRSLYARTGPGQLAYWGQDSMVAMLDASKAKVFDSLPLRNIGRHPLKE